MILKTLKFCLRIFISKIIPKVIDIFVTENYIGVLQGDSDALSIIYLKYF